MSRIEKINQKLKGRFLSYYELLVSARDGKSFPYYMVSRNPDAESLKAVTGENPPDGVIICSRYEEKLVLIRQFRFPAGRYVYELPAGLAEAGEDAVTAAVREMKEETGLDFHPLSTPDLSRPFFTTVGMTDESCATIFGYCSGSPTQQGQEDTEDIQVILADKAECRRILREESVAIMCAYQIMQFLGEEGNPFSLN